MAILPCMNMIWLEEMSRSFYSDGTFITNEYDTNGNKISETDQAGKTTKYEYSPDGNLIKVTDALNNEVSFEYDQLGNLIAQIDANGNITKFEYDKLGRKVKEHCLW